MRRLLHTSWISLLALVLLVLGTLYYLGWTEAGLQRLVSLANRRLGPVTLSLAGARGTLHSGLHFDRVEVDHQRVQIIATRIDGSVALLPLLWQTINVSHLDIGEVTVHVLPHVSQPIDTWEPHFLIGLLNIEAPRLRVGHATLISPGGTTLEANELRAAAKIDSKDIRIFDSTLDYSGFAVHSIGTVHAAQSIGLRGQIRLSRQAPTGEAPWLADGQINGNLDLLGVNVVLLAPFNASFHGKARALAGDWHWQGDLQVKDLDLRAWGAGNALGLISGPLQVSGNRAGFTARGALDPKGLSAGPLSVDFAGNYAAHALTIARLGIGHGASGAQVSAAGVVGIVDGGPKLDLRGQWRTFRWPLSDSSAPVRSSSGDYTLTGLKPYAFTASGGLQVLSEPALQFRAAGRLAHDGLDIPSATVTAFGGQAQLRADLKWSPQVRWSAAGQMRTLNIATLRPTINGHLNFAFTASGQGFGKDRTLQASITDLSGVVRGQSAGGHAGIALDGDEWSLQQVRVQLGATHIEADGRIGAQPDLHFAVDIADLALLQNGAHGRLKATGRLRGDTHNPVLLARIKGSDLNYERVSLHAVEAQIDFDPRGSGHADVNVQLDQLQIANRVVERASFATNGTAQAHRFNMQVSAAPLVVRAAGTGSFEDGVWHAQLNEFTASDGADMHLSLAAPSTLVAALNGEQLQLERLCLHDAAAAFCATAERVQDHNKFSLSAARVPLRALTAGVGGDTTYEGQVSLEARGESLPAAPWTGSVTGALADAVVRHHLSGGRIESFSLGNGNVQAALDASGLAASIILDAGSAGNISGHVAAQGSGAINRAWPLAGELRLQTQSLGFIDSYVAEIDRVSGQLDANLTLAGTLGAPIFNGELKVSHGEVDAYTVNLALRDLNLDARLKGTELQLQGDVKAGSDGHAQISGVVNWRDALPYGQLHLTGENLRVINIPEARVQASPDVYMKLNGHRIDVTGTVALPYARLLRPDTLTSAARTSSDEVIVSSAQGAAAESFHVFSDLTLKLGERVTIDTLGLVGRLSGSIRTVADDSGFNRGTGELQVEEGKYTAYGRKLDIERGRLQFKDGPLNDPIIDLRAVKAFPDITAGINVRGTLRQPRLTFFSDPPVSQSQIVSLLIAGGSLETIQNTSDPAQRNNAARNDMLLQGSAMLFQQFGSKVGLDDVSVESGLNNDTSLVLGRFLSPRLYVSYGVSLVESINTIKARYTIGDHWALRTEAGTAQSADLVYTIER
ncbi:MAG TPA: translocation/assembly module TamB domain-containing protein [Steroidobacteraceae bacterium]|nr:translocation/assembly module TamB domain-containing protein [Steroidobacteraceae bacterium]